MMTRGGGTLEQRNAAVVRRCLRVFETFAVEELAFLLHRDVIVYEGGTTVRGIDWVSAAVRTPGLAGCQIRIDDLFAARDRVIVARAGVLVMVRGAPTVTLALKLPMSLPPAPLNV